MLITGGKDDKEDVARPGTEKRKKQAELQDERAGDDSVQSEEDQEHGESRWVMP